MTDYREIVDALRSGAEQRPEMAETLGLYSALLDIQQAAAIQSPEIDVAEAQARLAAGEPILSLDTLAIDAPKLLALCQKLAFAIAERRRERVRDLAQIHTWLHKKRDHMRALAIEYLRTGQVTNGGPEIDKGLLIFVIDAGLRPFLRAYAESLGQYVQNSEWSRAYCPICGGQPDMAALEKDGGRRRLLCSRCDFEWTYKRLGCTFCGNDDPKNLSFYPSDDKVYRLAVCEECHRYLKTVDLREMAAERPLAAERVLTAGMDVAADKAGYKGS